MAKKIKILSTLRSRVRFGAIFILLVVLTITAIRSYSLLLKNVEQKIFVKQQRSLIASSEKIKTLLSTNINLAANLSTTFSIFEEIPQKNRRIFFKQNLNYIIENNPEIYGIWTVFKPYSIDTLDEQYASEVENLTGQFVAGFYKQDNSFIKEQKVDFNDYEKLDNYIDKLKGNNVLIIAPMKDPYWNLAGKSFIIRIVTPVVDNDKVIGLVGVDLHISEIKSFLKSFEYNVIVLSDDLNVIYNNDINKINKNLTEIYQFVSNNDILLSKIALNETYSNKGNLYSPNQEHFYSLYSFRLKNTDGYWNLLFSVNDKNFKKQARNQAAKILISPLIVFLVIFSFILIFPTYLFNTLQDINNHFKKLLDKKFKANFLNRKPKEFQDSYKTYNALRTRILKYKKYTDAILAQNFQEEIILPKDDILRDNIIELNKKLHQEQSKRIEQTKGQEIETKISNALAQINNIQREYNENLDELAYNTIKYISDFTQAVQGGFYIVKKEENKDPVLDLRAFYSYNRRIYNKKTIDFDDGLAGTCAKEKKTIFTNVPNNYLEITSGLGSNPPNYIFLIPLINNDEVMGVIELAFLKKIETYNKDFLNEASNVIASSIASSQTSRRTLKLLEETQSITKEMQEKEEKLNKQIAQLERLKKKNEISELDRSAILKAINQIVYFAEFDKNANVLSLNENLSEKIQLQLSDAMMLTYYDILMISDSEKHQNYWEKVLKGDNVVFELPVFLGKFNFWFDCILAPVFDVNNEVYKVIFFAIDITEIKQKEKEVKDLMMEMNEKAEQISVQEKEMDEFFNEYELLQESIENKDKEVKKVEKEKEKAEKSLDFLQKEFRKRTNRSKRIEMNLKKKVRALEDELKFFKGEK